MTSKYMNQFLFSNEMLFFIAEIAFIWTMVGKPTMVHINAISVMKKMYFIGKKRLIHIIRCHLNNIIKNLRKKLFIMKKYINLIFITKMLSDHGTKNCVTQNAYI